MGLVFEDTPKTFELAPAGNHAARCVQIIDWGSQKTEYFNKDGSVKYQQKVVLRFELLQEVDSNGEPFVVDSKPFTFTMYEAGDLPKFLTTWRGEPLVAGFELDKVLGANCFLTVVHNPSKDGKYTYANIASANPPAKGTNLKAMPNKTPLLSFCLADAKSPDFIKAFDSLPQRHQKHIKECVEWAAVAREMCNAASVAQGQPATSLCPEADELDENELPF
jgi:hypothetical protein